MFEKAWKILCMVSIALMLVPITSVQAQEKGDVVVISPKVGEVIDRQERDRYSLFHASHNFQSAVILQRPDGSYVVEITEGVSGAEQVRTLPIDRQTLDQLGDQIEQYHLDPIRQFRSSSGVQRKGPLAHIEITNDRQLRGFLQETSGDSIILINDVENFWSDRQSTAQRAMNIHLNDISSLALPRKSRLPKGILAGLGIGAFGALLGFAMGDDPPPSGWFDFSFTAEEKAAGLGLFLGGIGISIGGSLGALKSVDIDIPWEGKTEAQKRDIMAQVSSGQYRSPPFVKVSPWAGAISGPHGKVAAVFGGGLRYYFTPRSGFALNYGETRWFSSSSRSSQYYGSSWSETERFKINYISGGFFIFPIRKRSVIPFVAWGWGMTRTHTNSKTTWEAASGEYRERENDHTSNNFSIHFSGGVEIPLTSYLGLEGSLEEILLLGKEDFGNFKLALNFGPNF
jgi:hypothetical protein